MIAIVMLLGLGSVAHHDGESWGLACGAIGGVDEASMEGAVGLEE